MNLFLPGVYNLTSIGTVKCLQGGWTVIQHRGQYENPEDYFSKNWCDYVQGFGSSAKEHWIGLDIIYKLTNRPSTPMKLRIIMEDFSGTVKEASYNSFRIEDATDKYRLRIGSYSGSAGDAIIGGERNLNNMKFSTKDQDNDGSSGHCANTYNGWWFNSCMDSNLNGLNYDDGIADSAWKGILWYSSQWSNDYKRSLKTVT